MFTLVPRKHIVIFITGGVVFTLPMIAGPLIAPFLTGMSQATLRLMIIILKPLFLLRLPGYLVLHLSMHGDPYYLRWAAVSLLYFLFGGYLFVGIRHALRADWSPVMEAWALAVALPAAAFLVSAPFSPI
jgi:hypothetical protein